MSTMRVCNYRRTKKIEVICEDGEKRRKGFSFLLFCAPLFLVFALIVRRSGHYLRLSSFFLVCNLSRIINYIKREH